MSTPCATVPLLLGWRCPSCGDTFLQAASVQAHYAGKHHAGLLPWEFERATVAIPPACAFGADCAPFDLP